MRQTTNASRRAPAAVTTLLLCLAVQAGAAPLSLTEAEANGLEVGGAASAAPAPRAQLLPVNPPSRTLRDSASPRADDADPTGASPPVSKAVAAARQADERRRALLDEELRANPAQVVRDAPPATASYENAAPRREPNRARDEDLPLSSTQKSLVRDVIGTVREVVQHPLTWVAVALVAVGAAVMSLGGRRRNAPVAPRTKPASKPAPSQVVATVRHRPRRRH